uniref:LITAF domain-containing protein n=1 Tax=Acrobeloides nanus TaxID=290746 RepID=A0A914D4M4_9BILA
MTDHTSIAFKETALLDLDQRILLNENTDDPPSYGETMGKPLSFSVSTQTPPLSAPVVFGAQPITVWCSHCNRMITTVIEYESGDFAMFMCCCVTPWAMCSDSIKVCLWIRFCKTFFRMSFIIVLIV